MDVLSLLFSFWGYAVESNAFDIILQILPLFSKYKVVHFNRTDTRLANNGISLNLQKLRCRVNFQGLKFTPQIETLGYKLVRILQERGPFVALHLRYEMDMLAFLGCTHGCTVEEAEELKRLRFVMFEADIFQSKHSHYLSKVWCSLSLGYTH